MLRVKGAKGRIGRMVSGVGGRQDTVTPGKGLKTFMKFNDEKFNTPDALRAGGLSTALAFWSSWVNIFERGAKYSSELNTLRDHRPPEV